MRILLASVLAVVLIAGACCCGSPTDPVVTVTPAGCGRVHVDAQVSAGLSRSIEFVRDDGATAEVEVGVLASRVEVELPSLGGGTITVKDDTRSRTVPLPQTEPVALSLRPVGDPTQGREVVVALAASQAPGCDFEGTGFALVDGLRASAPLADNATELRISGLDEGRYTARYALIDPTGVRVAEAEAELVVGPPCVDFDLDGVMACEGDCDDADPAVHPGAEDIDGDGIDSDCDGVNGIDRDKDGHEDAAAGGDDCNDRNPAVHAGASVIDMDGDGYMAGEVGDDLDCDGTPDVVSLGGDCDDTRADVHPGLNAEPVVGNRRDDDCDGTVDEGTDLYDDDGDGETEKEGDCDDADARRFSAGEETYDCVDNDCDREVDEGTTAAEVDDRYEPNDTTPAPLSRATKNWLGGYKKTRDVVRVISRDGDDAERFSIGAHDGMLDNFGVVVTLVEGAQNVRYEAEITPPSGTPVSQVLTSPGQEVLYAGTADHSDSGTYEIRIQPSNSDLAWCPATFQIVSR